MNIFLAGPASAAIVVGTQDFESAVLDFKSGSSVNNTTGLSSSVTTGLDVYEGNTATGAPSTSGAYVDSVANIQDSAFATQFNLTGASPGKALDLTNTTGYIYYDLGTFSGETLLTFSADLYERIENGNVTMSVDLYRNNTFTAANTSDIALDGNSNFLGSLDLTPTTFGSAGNQPVQNVSNSIDLTGLGLSNGDAIFLRLANGGSGQMWSDEHSITAVPEPSSLALLGLGGLLVALRRRRS